MMIKKPTMALLMTFLLLILSFQAAAVFVNSKGKGEVILVPYYTVNNNLNTSVTITNTNQTPKAIKITLREGLNGLPVLSYNVYLGGFDTWTFVMGAIPSTVAGFEGEPSGGLFSNDQSCAPLFNKAKTEFTFEGLVDGPQTTQRTREGFIEIIEMGELQGDAAESAQAVNGLPGNCSFFETAWQEGGIWHESSGGNSQQDLAPASGGLMAEVDIIHVGEGVNYSIPVVALADFFADETVNHAAPADASLSLDAAAPKATVLSDTKAYQLSFERGIDAVSAVLMADELMATYALDFYVNARSETIYTQPTRRFYIEAYNADPPYGKYVYEQKCVGPEYGWSKVNLEVFDRDGYFDAPQSGGFTPPAQSEFGYCGSVFVTSNKNSGSQWNNERSILTQASNFVNINNTHYGTESGYVRTQFYDIHPLPATDIETGQTLHLKGLPVIGVTLMRFTNNNAQPGIMAQYGFAYPLKVKKQVIEQ
jgi:hypothetical protein